MMQYSPWILTRPCPHARLRLFCFPYAGGSAAAFLSWQALLPPSIQLCAVQLPGRGARFTEPCETGFKPLITNLADVIRHQSHLPFAFFGHSLGGLVAFELARECQRTSLPQAHHLFVSATNAPQHQPCRPDFDEIDDEHLIETLRDYNGTPAALLENRELMDLLLPAIRADFSLLNDYRYQTRDKLEIPLSVLAGRQDQHLIQAHLPAWQAETSAACHLRWFEGDHFYLQNEAAAVIDLIQTELQAYL
tara:strand:+ start:152932 stop:153678 length:747 start_codon:yes stop_codon:yes gene_type:complete